MDPAVVTLCVLAVACFLFVTELIPLAVTAMAACTALGILGVLPSKQVYAGLSNSTVVLFGGMFVIGAAMFRTGLAQAIGLGVVKKAGTKEVPLMGAVMLVTIILSSVSSNTGTVACLMPVVIGICQAAKISQSRQLMPLAIAANVGGTITMIGTPPNVIVTGALSQQVCRLSDSSNLLISVFRCLLLSSSLPCLSAVTCFLQMLPEKWMKKLSGLLPKKRALLAKTANRRAPQRCGFQD